MQENKEKLKEINRIYLDLKKFKNKNGKGTTTMPTMAIRKTACKY